MTTCKICNREATGFAWYDPDLRPRMSIMHPACSIDCLNLIIDTKGKFVHTTKSEKAAIEIGGRAGGEYLDSIGKYSLDQLSADEYYEYCSRVYVATCDELRRVVAMETEVPY